MDLNNDYITFYNLIHILGQGAAICFWLVAIIHFITYKKAVNNKIFWKNFLISFSIVSTLIFEWHIHEGDMSWNIIGWYPINIFLSRYVVYNFDVKKDKNFKPFTFIKLNNLINKTKNKNKCNE